MVFGMLSPIVSCMAISGILKHWAIFFVHHDDIWQTILSWREVWRHHEDHSQWDYLSLCHTDLNLSHATGQMSAWILYGIIQPSYHLVRFLFEYHMKSHLPTFSLSVISGWILWETSIFPGLEVFYFPHFFFRICSGITIFYEKNNIRMKYFTQIHHCNV